jgi:hypothetical protein
MTFLDDDLRASAWHVRQLTESTHLFGHLVRLGKRDRWKALSHSWC